MKLSNYSALTFDCYGTLIDWETGILNNLAPLVAGASRSLTSEDVLQAHARFTNEQQANTPSMNYRQVLATTYMRMAMEWGAPVDNASAAAYGNTVGTWLPFDDTVEALSYLKQHYKLVILSNVDRASFAETNERLAVTFDAVITAEDVGSYKPAQQNFDAMFRRLSDLGVNKGEILHTAASLYHDHIPANRCALASAWIDRRHDRKGAGATMQVPEMPDYTFRFKSLGEMADAHREESAA